MAIKGKDRLEGVAGPGHHLSPRESHVQLAAGDVGETIAPVRLGGGFGGSRTGRRKQE